MTDAIATILQALTSAIAAIGMVALGIFYLVGYGLGMRFQPGAGGVIGMVIAPILGLIILVLFGIWLF